MIQTQLGSRFRIAGVARSPDREGALAHLDPDRGFALVARGAMGPADVIDPTIWVKEKLSLALSTAADPADTPLKRVIGALRALHAELMARPEGDRPWVAVLVLLLQGEDAVAVSAGDCPCFRYRSGLLSRLGRAEPDAGPNAPRGALGSEPQVRIEVVPLKPEPGDLYVLSTRPLRDGEIALLARDLGAAQEPVHLLRAGADGAADRGRVAVRVLRAQESESIGPTAEQVDEASEAVAVVPEPDPIEVLEVAPLAWTRADEPSIVDEALEEPGPGVLEPIAPSAPDAVLVSPSGAPGFVAEALDAAAADEETAASESAEPDVEPAPAVDQERPRTQTLAPVGEDRAWYEPLALWGGGALAIIAVAVLIRALLPGILGEQGRRGSMPPAPVAVSGTADIFSDPPGAIVRVDGSRARRTHASDRRLARCGSPSRGARLGTVRRLARHGGGFRRGPPHAASRALRDGRVPILGDRSRARRVPGRRVRRNDAAHSRPGRGGTAPRPVRRSGSRDERAGDRRAPREGLELVGSVGPSPLDGTVEVKSTLLGDAGFEPRRGDPFWVDGTPRGVTPGKVTLGPGTHSVRVARRGFPPQVTIIDVKSEGQAFVTAEFGARLRGAAPVRSSRSDRPVESDSRSRSRSPSRSGIRRSRSGSTPRLAGGTFQPKRMTRLEEGSRSYAALVPPEVLRSRVGQVRIYFMASGTSGHEIYSEIYTLPVRN